MRIPYKVIRVLLFSLGSLLVIWGQKSILGHATLLGLALSVFGVTLVVVTLRLPGKGSLSIKPLIKAGLKKSLQRWMKGAAAACGEAGERLTSLPAPAVIRLALLLTGMVIIHFTHGHFGNYLSGRQDLIGKALGVLCIAAAARPPRLGWRWREEAGAVGAFSRWRTPALLAAVFLIGASQWYYLHGSAAFGLKVTVVAIGALLIGFRDMPGTRLARGPAQLRPGRRHLAGLGVILLAGGLFSYHCRQGELSAAAWALLLLFVAVLLWGEPLAGERRRQAGGLGRGDFLALAGVLAVMVFFRTYQLGSMPAGLLWDEGLHAGWSLAIADGYKYPFFFSSVTYAGPMIYNHFMAVMIKMLGFGQAAFRSPTVVFSLLLAPYTYLLARELFGRRTAVISSLFFAFSFWPVFFSRIGFHWIFPALLFVAGLYHFLLGLDRGRNGEFLLAGVYFGFSIYFYDTAVVIPLVIFSYLFYLGWRDRGLLRRRWAGLVSMAGGAFAVALPVLFFFVFRLGRLTDVVNQAMISRTDHPWAYFMNNLIIYPMALFHRTSRTHLSLPEEPLLDPVSVALLAVGMVVVLLNWRREKMFLLAAWLCCGFLPGVLSSAGEMPQTPRITFLMPPVCLLIGLVVAEGYRLLRGALRSVLARGVLFLLLAAMLAGVGLKNYNMYFVRYANNAWCWNSYRLADSMAGRFMRRLALAETEANRRPGGDDRTVAHISGFWWHHAHTFSVFRYRLHDVELPMGGAGSMLRAGQADQTAVMVVEPVYRELGDWLREFYPGLEYHQLANPAPGRLWLPRERYNNDLLAIAYVVRGKDFTAPRGLEMTVYSQAGLQGAGRQQLVRDVNFRGGPGQGSVRWRGSFLARQAGRCVFSVHCNGDYSLRLDGREVPGVRGRRNTAEHTLYLAQGFHRLDVSMLSGRVLRLASRCGESQGAWWSLSAGDFFRGDRSQGLLARFFACGSGFAGEPAHQRLYPLLLSRWYIHDYVGEVTYPFEVEWSGKVLVPADGEYEFEVSLDDPCAVYVDGVKVFAGAKGEKSYGKKVFLGKGAHAIRVRDEATMVGSTVILYWSRGGGERQVIPHHRLRPRF